MEITIPFKCSKCGIEFIQNEGGICSSCHNLFCISHLNIIKVDKTIEPICVDCSKGHEKDKGFIRISREDVQ